MRKSREQSAGGKRGRNRKKNRGRETLEKKSQEGIAGEKYGRTSQEEIARRIPGREAREKSQEESRNGKRWRNLQE